MFIITFEDTSPVYFYYAYNSAISHYLRQTATLVSTFQMQIPLKPSSFKLSDIKKK